MAGNQFVAIRSFKRKVQSYMPCIVLSALFSVSIFTGGGVAKELTCSICKQPIAGRYIKIKGDSYHPRCFICPVCGKPIESSFHQEGNRFYHPICFKKNAGLICALCRQPLENNWAVFEKRKYHKACLEKELERRRPRCAICLKPIQGKYTSDDAGEYHIDCFKKHKLPICDICSKPLDTKFILDPWGNRSHVKHGRKNTATCDSCQRIISAKTSLGGYQYNDGRFICGICKETAIEHQVAVSVLIPDITGKLSAVGIHVSPDIPVYLVDKKALRKKSGKKHAANTRGFTQCSIKYVNGKKEALKQTVYVLTGLPRLEFEGVLAHELLHVWLNEHSIKLDDSRMEGFCNLGAMLIYQGDGTTLAQLLLQNMENDLDPAYGRGYREMKRQLEKMGWSGLIKALLN